MTERTTPAIFHLAGPYPSDNQTVYVSEASGARLMKIEDEAGNQLGIDFKADGTFVVGGWDEEGEWIELTVARPCKLCQPHFHASQFELNQYTAKIAKEA